MDVSNGDFRRLRETGKQEVSESIRLKTNQDSYDFLIVYLKPGGDPFLSFGLRLYQYTFFWAAIIIVALESTSLKRLL